MGTCILCGWLLDAEHVFNIKCAAANAENDQLEAEVRDAQNLPGSVEDDWLMAVARAAAWEALDKARRQR